MKYSIYNSIIETNANLNVLYSGVSNRFVVFKKELTPLLSKSVDELRNVSDSFYNMLVEADAIISKERDEFREVKQISEKIDEAPHECKIIINPTMDCNFKCWYCYENHVKDSKIAVETLQSIKLLINRSVENKSITLLDISFFGGEPLLEYPVVRELIDYVRAKCEESNTNYNIGFTSNGYLLNDQIIEHLVSVPDSKSFQITLDGDREKHNRVRFEQGHIGSYDTIVQNIKRLISNKIFVILRINYTLHNIESVSNILNDIKDITKIDREYLKISFHRVWQDIDNSSNPILTSSVIESFNKEFNQTHDEHNLNEMRFPCYGDKRNTVVINYNGDIYKCTARDFSVANRYGVLLSDGTIEWQQNKLDRRNHAKMSKKICKKCRILPLCAGGCAQNSVENSENFCVHNMSEDDKDKVILNHSSNKGHQIRADQPVFRCWQLTMESCIILIRY